MADQHIGYPGTVGATQLANWMPNVASAQYSVDGPLDCKVTTNTVGDRGVTVAAGTIIGDGILDVFEGSTNLNFGSVSSGSPDRWDMVVLRRTWSSTPGASTSIFTIIPGGPNRSLPSRNNNKGVIADQPIALCRIKAGQTAVQEVVDLRCWAHNGGVVALDDLVMSYLDQPGTQLTIERDSWVRTVTASGTTNTAGWARDTGLDSIALFGRGSQAPNNANPGDQTMNQFLVQCGFSYITSDSNGFCRLTFPKPFPNGLIHCSVSGANDDMFNDINCVPAGASWGSTALHRTQVVFRIYGARSGVRDRDWPNRRVLYTWFVIGY
jgi:hypothetical protein